MKLSRIIHQIPAYATCLMLALATPMTAYAQDSAQPEVASADTSQQSSEPTPTVVPAETESRPTGQEAAPQAPEQETQLDQSAPPKEASDVKVVEPQAPSASNTTNSAAVSADTTVAIANALDSIAVSGTAKVKDNGTAGSATSGNASATATIVNGVNSSMSNTNNKEAATFVKDIMGDVNGDIMLHPMLLKAMLEAQLAQTESGAISSSNNLSITNDANLTAKSGDALVKDNRNAGNATTGTADTVANIVNLVNSMVSANESFIGTVNIYGNLNGDILIAPDFIPQMIANNASVGSNDGGVTRVNSQDTTQIVNNISLAAESGAALVRDNVQAGDATTGDAMTNLVIFNLSGHEIVASNSLLVFINVLGTWVGVIVDAPQGATAATVGNGVTENNIRPSMVVDAENNTAITNNISLSSQSGKAVVADNGTAGNATSGRATASANVANITNSSLGLSGWFGVLFINVFGTWNGSFGIDTAAGNSAAQPVIASPVQQNGGPLRFIPREQRTNRSSIKKLAVVNPVQSAQVVEEDEAPAVTEASAIPEVKGASTTKSDIPSQQSYIDARKSVNVPLIAMSLVLIIGSGYVLRKHLF